MKRENRTYMKKEKNVQKKNPIQYQKNTETKTEKNKHKKDCSDIEQNIDAEKIEPQKRLYEQIKSLN